jgi:NADPH:quinone reductase
MRAIRIQQFGGPEAMGLEELPTPKPGDGQALVRIEAAGVNFIDVYQRTGLYKNPLPYGLGLEGAGVVEAVGGGVTTVRVGDRVAWTGIPGSYATHNVVPADKLVTLPAGVDARAGASAMLQGMTAHYLCVSTYPVKEGDDVLVHAAAGGVGLLLTQMVKLRGGRVIATTSTEEKAALARGAGADETLGYDGFAERARELTDGNGVDVVFDGIAKATFEGSLASLRRRGTLVLYGMASGPVPPYELENLRKGSLYVTRPGLPDYTATREELEWRAGEVFGWIADGKLDVRIGERYALEDARRAHEDLEARRSTGKLVLLP